MNCCYLARSFGSWGTNVCDIWIKIPGFSHYNDVTWPLWRLKSGVVGLLVEHGAPISRIKTSHCFRKAFPCHDVVVEGTSFLNVWHICCHIGPQYSRDLIACQCWNHGYFVGHSYMVIHVKSTVFRSVHLAPTPPFHLYDLLNMTALQTQNVLTRKYYVKIITCLLRCVFAGRHSKWQAREGSNNDIELVTCGFGDYSQHAGLDWMSLFSHLQPSS